MTNSTLNTKETKTAKAVAAARNTKRNEWLFQKFGFDTSKLLTAEQRGIIVAKIRSICGSDQNLTMEYYKDLRKAFKVRRFGLLKAKDFEEIMHFVENKASEEQYKAELEKAKAAQRLAKFEAAKAKEKKAAKAAAKKTAVKKPAAKAKTAAKAAKPKTAKAVTPEITPVETTPPAAPAPMVENTAVAVFDKCVAIDEKAKSEIYSLIANLSENERNSFQYLEKKHGYSFINMDTVLGAQNCEDKAAAKVAAPEEKHAAEIEKIKAEGAAKRSAAKAAKVAASEAKPEETKPEEKPAKKSFKNAFLAAMAKNVFGVSGDDPNFKAWADNNVTFSGF